MSLDSEEVCYSYIISGVVIVLVLLLVVGSVYKTFYQYEKDAKIAVRTSRGLIKMNAHALAEELAKIQAELSKHEGYERTTKFDEQIDQVVAQIKEFINKNPSDRTLCKLEAKSDIIDKAMGERLNPNKHDQHAAHQTVIDHDELSHGPDSLKFDFLLKNIDVLIGMLNRDVCDGGLVNVYELEQLLRALDLDLTNGAEYVIEPNFSPGYGEEIAARHDPYMIPRLSLFAAAPSQIEGMSVESQHRPIVNQPNYSLGPQNIRDMQQRSQMFRVNRQALGTKQYIDEDLLLDSSYKKMAV